MGNELRPAPVWPAYVTAIAFGTLPHHQLAVANRAEIDLGRLAMWWVLVTLMLVAVVAAAHRWGSPRRTAVFVGAGAYLLFQFQAVRDLHSRLGLGDGAEHWTWTVVLMLTLAFLVPLSRRRGVQLFVSIFGCLMLIVASAGIVAPTDPAPAGRTTSPPAAAPAERPEERPNIWVFVPDGYSRADGLAEHVGLDVSHWLAQLEDRGFQVADRAQANYPVTAPSLASMLDMEYLVDEDDSLTDFQPLFDRIGGNNRTVDRLRSWGYTYVHAHSGTFWDGTRCGGLEDRCIGDERLAEVDVALARSTPIAWLVDRAVTRQLGRLANPEWVVEEVLSMDTEGPRLVFSHLMSPHPPFLWEADCTFRPGVAGVYASGRLDEYANQARCLNRRLVRAIDRILDEDPTAIIMLQSDHGADFGLHLTDSTHPSWEGFAGAARFPLMAAYRLPDGCIAPDDLSPVNAMRLLFSCLSGGPFDPLPYRSMVAVYGREVSPRPPSHG